MVVPGHTPQGCGGASRYPAGSQSPKGALNDNYLLELAEVEHQVPESLGSGPLKIWRLWQETGLGSSF